jgi:hypothetical protein
MYPRKMANVHAVKLRKSLSWRADLSKSARALRGAASMLEPDRRAGMESRAAARATKPRERMAVGKPEDFVSLSNMTEGAVLLAN